MGFVAINHLRSDFVNSNTIRRARVLHDQELSDRLKEPTFYLQITYLTGEQEKFVGVEARELWIALGLADPISIDEVPTKWVTPFGEKPIM